jgi:hypothetical protein
MPYRETPPFSLTFSEAALIFALELGILSPQALQRDR